MKLIAAINCIAFFCFVSCSSSVIDENTVTVYVSADEQLARSIFAEFTAKTGIEVAWVGDTEASKTTALVQRLLREQDDPVADVFWSSEILGTMQLSEANVLAPCTSSVGKTWPEQYRASDYTWFAFSPRARVIAYDPQKIVQSALPEYWWEYSEAVMADPRFGTTGTHLAVLSLFPEQFQVFLNKKRPQTLLGGNAATVQAVIDGSATFAMTDSDDVHAGIARGASIAMHYPKHHNGPGGGTLLIPNTVAVIENCKHAKNASAFIDFMLSDYVEIFLAESPSHNIPIQPKVAKQFPSLQVPDPLSVTFVDALRHRESAITEFMGLPKSEEE